MLPSPNNAVSTTSNEGTPIAYKNGNPKEVARTARTKIIPNEVFLFFTETTSNITTIT